MEIIKRIWFFVFIMIALPLFIIISIGYFTPLISPFIDSILTSIATSLIAAGIVYWFIDKRLKSLLETDDEITIILESPNGEIKKCPPISRKTFSRAEVLGYLGMLGGSQRYEIKDLANFCKDILDMQKSKGNQNLTLKCTDEEIKQFIVEGRQHK